MTARSTFWPRTMCFSGLRNSHPLTIRLPELTWKCRAIFLLASPFHECAITEAHGATSINLRNLVARPPKSAVAQSDHTHVRFRHLYHGGIVPVKGRKFSVRDQQSKLGSLLHEHRTIAVVGTDAQKVPITSARSGLDKSISNSVGKTKCIQNVLPIGPPKSKSLSMRHLPIQQLAVRTPPRIEVHVLDSPDVIDRIDPDASPKGLPCNVPNIVALILACIDTLIRVQQLDVKDGRVLAAHRNRPRIRLWFTIGNLLWVIDRQPAHGTVRIQGEKGSPMFVPAFSRHKESGSVVTRLRLPVVPHSRM